MSFTSRNEKFKSKSSANAIPIGSIILDLPPSCLEFVPISQAVSWAAETPFFVVGTYDLQKEEVEGGKDEEENENTVSKEQSRQGSLSLYSLKDDVLTDLQTFPTPAAILDLHFFPDTAIFAVASSTGTISIFELQQSSEGKGSSASRCNITPIATHQVLEEDAIITYFSWDPTSTIERPRMAITSTNGAVMTLFFNSSWTEFEILNDGEAISQHEYEAWCCAFSETAKTLYSGGDDSRLISSSLDQDFRSSRKLPFHNAGVTAILPIPNPKSSVSSVVETELLLTGSYDDFIRVYQPPSPTNPKPKVLIEKDIGQSGGGVWRLKFLNEADTQSCSNSPETQTTNRSFLVLASCMRVGCKIIKISESENGDWSCDVLATTAIHESMNYASDIVPLATSQSRSQLEVRTIVSTSFYDRLLFVWKYDPNITVTDSERPLE